MNKEQIKKEAKEILDKFASVLGKVKIDEGDFHFSREEFEREEGKGELCNFKDKLLRNAPLHDEDFVIVERGEWK